MDDRRSYCVWVLTLEAGSESRYGLLSNFRQDSTILVSYRLMNRSRTLIKMVSAVAGAKFRDSHSRDFVMVLSYSRGNECK